MPLIQPGAGWSRSGAQCSLARRRDSHPVARGCACETPRRQLPARAIEPLSAVPADPPARLRPMSACAICEPSSGSDPIARRVPRPKLAPLGIMLRITLPGSGSLYYSSDSVRCLGAAVQYLAHSSSFGDCDGTPPSYLGTKQTSSLKLCHSNDCERGARNGTKTVFGRRCLKAAS